MEPALFALAGAAVMAVAQVGWEVFLHNRTVRLTKEETGPIRQRVEDAITQASGDREKILGEVKTAVAGTNAALEKVASLGERVDALKEEVVEGFEERLAFVREEAEKRIMAANVELQRRQEEARASLAAESQALEERAAQLEKSLEMARRGMQGNEARAEQAQTAAELSVVLETKLGPGAATWLQKRFPDAWKAILKAPPFARERMLDKAKETWEKEGGAEGLVMLAPKQRTTGGGWGGG